MAYRRSGAAAHLRPIVDLPEPNGSLEERIVFEATPLLRADRRALELEAALRGLAQGVVVVRLPDGFTLMWAGRVSRDKNVDFLADIYEQVRAEDPNVNLVIAGDGPALAELRERLSPYPNARLLGKIPREELCALYGLADVFVFPSDMDTFGMVVLESQACGLPAIVTDEGGPQEIVQDGNTGFVISLREPERWVEKILDLKYMKAHLPGRFEALRENIRNHVFDGHTLDDALADVLGVTLSGEELASSAPSATPPPREKAAVA